MATLACNIGAHTQPCCLQPAPVPPKRDLVKLPPAAKVALHSEGRFTVLSYNILADLYATVSSHARALAAPPWARDWLPIQLPSAYSLQKYLLCLEYEHVYTALHRRVEGIVAQALFVSAALHLTYAHHDICSCCCVQTDAFPYCPAWVLSWQYRKQNLLKEVLSYRADILCLQVTIKPSSNTRLPKSFLRCDDGTAMMISLSEQD